MSSKNINHNKINHFVDSLGKPFAFDLMDPSLPAWNYSISGKTGSGMSVGFNDLNDEELATEIYKKKLAEENELFDHFISTGTIKNKSN